ncbi:class I SAM-dependent methyltransferase [Microvirga sp. TS319]|uniref:class I SAM-dependent methyltransferase n=1 Tax=Microvirga sp. TS319 TaxID=3241165 RepID=UPI00351A8B18
MDQNSSSPNAAASQKGQYWENFYAKASVPEAPSQFAAFATGELEDIRTIVDVGCGSGRDSFFFASLDLNVLGVDNSEVVIQRCLDKSKTRRVPNIAFMQGSVSSSGFENGIRDYIASSKLTGPILIYARFFLHAITETEERDFLAAASRLTGLFGGKLAVEFRTPRDQAQTKVTPEHYRRYVAPLEMIDRARNVGFKLSYFVEGFGFAKHKQDDAHVARCVFTRE